jgi:hypothetical protein
MNVSDQSHRPAVLLPGREPPVLTEQEVAWDPVTVWTLWIREKSDDPLEDQPVPKIRQYNKGFIPVVINSPIAFREKRWSS